MYISGVRISRPILMNPRLSSDTNDGRAASHCRQTSLRTANRGVLGSIEAVRDELLQGTDELSDWAQQRPNFFAPLDQPTANQFRDLTKWVNSQSFTPAALNNYTENDADYLLVAYAKAHGYTVVTREASDPKSKKRVKIPNACAAMGVRTVNFFDVLRNTGAQLII